MESFTPKVPFARLHHIKVRVILYWYICRTFCHNIKYHLHYFVQDSGLFHILPLYNHNHTLFSMCCIAFFIHEFPTFSLLLSVVSFTNHYFILLFLFYNNFWLLSNTFRTLSCHTEQLSSFIFLVSSLLQLIRSPYYGGIRLF